MKTIPELINEIHVDAANFQHIAKTGKINGTLFLEIQRIMAVFTCQEILEALKLFGIEDPSTQNNELVIPHVSGSLPGLQSPELDKHLDNILKSWRGNDR